MLRTNGIRSLSFVNRIRLEWNRRSGWSVVVGMSASVSGLKGRKGWWEWRTAPSVGLGSLVVVVLVLVAGAGMVRPGRASACSMIPWTEHVEDVVAESRVIAVGQWTDAEATLVVEDGLRGAAPGDRFVTDNRLNAPYLGCGAWNPPGRRFTDGEQAIVFFKRRSEGRWEISWLGYATQYAPADDGQPLGLLGPGEEAVTFADLRRLAAKSNEWFVPVATVVLGLAAAATVVGGVRAVRR